MTKTTHRRFNCIALMLAVIVAGFVWRLAPLHLPYFFFKYGGSALWAVAVYLLLAAIVPRDTSLRVAMYAFAASGVVEFSRLFHTPGFDAFRASFTGRFLLGRYFSLKNIVAYWLAIAVVAWLDARVRAEE